MYGYDYKEAVKDDVKKYIEENYTCEELRAKMQDRDEFAEELRDDCFCADEVTGNASGSYTFSTWEAENYICHNYDILAEALDELGYIDENPFARGAEWCDVVIRCYMLDGAIETALDEIEEELK